MEMDSLNELDGIASVIRGRRSALQRMTPTQLLHLGMNQVAYLKFGTRDGKVFFGVYSADGTSIAATDDINVAIGAAAEQGLSFVSVH